MKILTLNLAIATLLLCTSCNNTPKNTTQEISAETAQTTALTETPHEGITFTDTKWTLVRIMDKDVADSNAFISFATDENRVFGNAGCNNFSGTYELRDGNQFSLSPLAATKKMCVDMSIEDQFLTLLGKVDNYTIKGNQLTLQKAKTAPLAVFNAVE